MTAPSQLREYDIGAKSTDVFGRVMCNARAHHFIVDGPVQNGCPGEEVTPPELLLSSVAACGVELVQVIARELAKAVASVEVQVHAVLDRANQPRPNVTVYNKVHMTFTLHGTDGTTASQLVEAFKRR
ncbi:MAG TPA: OsmC family protein [Gemmatimonadaceae bacterium]